MSLSPSGLIDVSLYAVLTQMCMPAAMIIRYDYLHVVSEVLGIQKE